jgi:hypothetical protein
MAIINPNPIEVNSGVLGELIAGANPISDYGEVLDSAR